MLNAVLERKETEEDFSLRFKGWAAYVLNGSTWCLLFDGLTWPYSTVKTRL